MKAEEKKILELAKEAEKIFSEETKGVFFGSDFVVGYVTAYKLKDTEIKEAREKVKELEIALTQAETDRQGMESYIAGLEAEYDNKEQ